MIGEEENHEVQKGHFVKHSGGLSKDYQKSMLRYEIKKMCP
jgi:hypothetical protein